VTNFEQGYRDIANAVRILGRNDKGADILTLVYEWLRDKSNGNWVLILDNADDKDVFSSRPSNQRLAEAEKQIREFLPQSSNGSILVTSRSRDAGYEVTTNYKHVFTVEEMTKDEAMSLLEKQLDESHPEDEKKMLVEKLGYVPLAVSQAAANISRRSLPIPDYIKELEKVDDTSASLLEESLPQLQRDPARSNSVVATWKVTFEYVRKASPSAARLLSLMCLFDRQNIPEALLQKQYGEEVNAPPAKPRKVWWKRRLRSKKRKEKLVPVKAVPYNFEDDWLVLRDFSLIKLNRDRKHFSMHPIVQFSTKRWLVLHKQLTPWSHRFISVIYDAYPDVIHLDDEMCHKLLAHAYATVTYRPVNAATQPLQIWAALMRRLASQHIHWTAIETAEKLFHAAAQAFEISLGPSVSQSLQCNSERAMWLIQLGQHSEAEKLHNRALQIRFGYTGPDYTGTPDSMNDIGDALTFQRRYEEADHIYARALNQRIQKLGSGHESTQRNFDTYARFLCSQGRHQDAYNTWRQAHEARIQGQKNVCDVIWIEHLNYIGLSHLMAGNPHGAEQYFREVVAENEKGAPSDSLGRSLVQLGRLLAQLEKYTDAEVYLKRAMEWYDNEARCKETYCFETIGLLAFVLWKLDKLEDADRLAQRCLIEQTEHLGRGDEETLRSMWILAGVREKQERCDEALELYKRVVDTAEEFLGGKSEDAKDWRRDYEALLGKMEKDCASGLLNHEKCDAIVEQVGMQDSCEDTSVGAEKEDMEVAGEKVRLDGISSCIVIAS
jgi:tetratricopeptide (TPR) repeat protein